MGQSLSLWSDLKVLHSGVPRLVLALDEDQEQGVRLKHFTLIATEHHSQQKNNLVECSILDRSSDKYADERKLYKDKETAQTQQNENNQSSPTMFYSSLSDSTSSFSRCFLRSSLSSRYVLQLSRKKATIIKMPPMIAANESGCPVRSQSTMATRKIVKRAATDERTGDVREMRTRKEPENAARN